MPGACHHAWAAPCAHAVRSQIRRMLPCKWFQVVEQEQAAGQPSSKALACSTQRMSGAPQSLCGMPLGHHERHKSQILHSPHRVRERMSVAGRQRSVTSSVMPCVQAFLLSSSLQHCWHYGNMSVVLCFLSALCNTVTA